MSRRDNSRTAIFQKIIPKLKDAVKHTFEEQIMQAAREAVDSFPETRRKHVGLYNSSILASLIPISCCSKFSRLLVEELGLPINEMVAVPLVRNSFEKMPLIFAALSTPALFPFMEFLLEKKVDLLKLSTEGEDVLSFAVTQDHVDIPILENLIKNGADVNANQPGSKFKPIVNALRHRRIDVALFLRNNDADPWAEDFAKESAFTAKHLTGEKNFFRLTCVLKRKEFNEIEMEAVDRILYPPRWYNTPTREQSKVAVGLLKRTPLDNMRVKFLRRALLDNPVVGEWNEEFNEEVEFIFRDIYLDQLIEDELHPLGLRLYALQIARSVLGPEMPCIRSHILLTITDPIPGRRALPLFIEYFRAAGTRTWRPQPVMPQHIIEAYSKVIGLLLDDELRDDYWQMASEEIFLYLGDLLRAHQHVKRELDEKFYELVLKLYDHKQKFKRPDSRFGRSTRYFLQHLNRKEFQFIERRSREQYFSMLPHLKSVKKHKVTRPHSSI